MLEAFGYIYRKYTEAVMPLLEERDAIGGELVSLDAVDRTDRVRNRCLNIILANPFLDQAELVRRHAEITCKVFAYGSQEQEKAWIREYEDG